MAIGRITSYMRDLKGRNPYVPAAVGELVPDPGFDDASAWSIDGALGLPASNVEISDSLLKSTSTACLGIVKPDPLFSLELGKAYTWEINVQSVGAGGGLVNLFIDNTLKYQHSSGAGVFSGEFTYTGLTVLQVSISNKIIEINSISITTQE